MSKELKEILINGALELGLELTSAQVEAFFLYLKELKRWNEKINLTSITDDKEIVERHLLDSLTICRFIPKGAKVLDIGSGGGFPGIPIKIALPRTEVVLIESTKKKCVFLSHIARSLKLDNLRVIPERAESETLQSEFSVYFDVVTSRAFSALKDFLPVAARFTAPEGMIIAMKGPLASDKKGLSEDTMKGVTPLAISLGLKPIKTEKIELPNTDRQTLLLFFQKG